MVTYAQAYYAEHRDEWPRILIEGTTEHRGRHRTEYATWSPLVTDYDPLCVLCHVARDRCF